MKAVTLPLFILAACALARAEEARVTAPPEPEGMVKLFNGKDLTGWDGDPKLWSVKDGVIRAESTPENPCKSNTFLLWQGGELKDFELRLSFRIEKGNSGIQYRSRHLKDHKDNKWVVAGYQAEVENTPGKVGFLYHEKCWVKGRGYPGRGSWMCDVGDKVEVDDKGVVKSVGKLGDPKAIAATYKKGDWNDYVIIAKGNRVQHFLNGVQTVDLTDNDPNGQSLSGILALQIHSGPPMWVEFKDVRIKKYE